MLATTISSYNSHPARGPNPYSRCHFGLLIKANIKFLHLVHSSGCWSFQVFFIFFESTVSPQGGAKKFCCVPPHLYEIRQGHFDTFLSLLSRKSDSKRPANDQVWGKW